MKERAILFTGAMVRAILNGTKTQTRRVVKGVDPVEDLKFGSADGTRQRRVCSGAYGPWVKSPYGQPGDRLWVRETWRPHCAGPISAAFPLGTCVKFRADDALMKPATWTNEQGAWCEAHEEDTKWRPSIFMPRWASRITLEIVTVRVERLQDISEADALAEGVPPIDTQVVQSDGSIKLFRLSSRNLYQSLWNQIHGPGAWDTNPWVWVVGFRRIEQ